MFCGAYFGFSLAVGGVGFITRGHSTVATQELGFLTPSRGQRRLILEVDLMACT